MISNRLISVLTLFAAMASPAVAASSRALITTAQVAAAINSTGMKIAAEQVTLLTEVMAQTDAPTLKVESMEPWGDHRMKVRLDCESRDECMPFFVAIRCDQESALQSSDISRAKLASKSYIVRSGSPVTLLLEGGHLHIQVSVVCLENGAAGQTIRVASKDRKQTYTAQVVDASIVRGNL